MTVNYSCGPHCIIDTSFRVLRARLLDHGSTVSTYDPMILCKVHQQCDRPWSLFFPRFEPNTRKQTMRGPAWEGEMMSLHIDKHIKELECWYKNLATLLLVSRKTAKHQVIMSNFFRRASDVFKHQPRNDSIDSANSGKSPPTQDAPDPKPVSSNRSSQSDPVPGNLLLCLEYPIPLTCY